MDQAFAGSLARVVLRYGSGAGVALGLFGPDVATALGTDPDLLAVVSAIVGVLVEYFWTRSKRRLPGPR